MFAVMGHDAPSGLSLGTGIVPLPLVPAVGMDGPGSWCIG